ncbi:DUF1800 domain-containing protein [Teichococcus vastitatis]|uniref:DUF1800 domain-containing protein n=1 Tax=Teichococcus vastitatis TaxID=2307076 RepID=A0ABS9W3P8_9PROT|nr:DUF1800 domain-containing protein [Pseudoroseomonas vastitatis]MCI0753912.1 DUF1800 domain-containing protein [Pseudoroseomonas vastitatis]
MEMNPWQAVIRFGLGSRPDQALPADPLAWLDAQLQGPDPAPPVPAGWPAAPAVPDGYRVLNRSERVTRRPGQRHPVDLHFEAEVIAAQAVRIDTGVPYRERLVEFWANHFTVARRAGYGAAVAIGPFLREAIRPHVNGRFADMLQAVATHPAMLSYLDQSSSVGPGSRLGRRSGKGLNENLAREILELHTVSPAAGYTQADVTEFARLLTGWGNERWKEPLGVVFRSERHEPGAKTVMGRRFEEGPQATAEALRFLAGHPATGHRLATKLVRHFVADDPPPGAVARIEGVLRDSGGDLQAVAAALPRLPQAWDPPLGKLRSPLDYATAALRACGAQGIALGMFAWASAVRMNQSVWDARQPNGWPDQAASWLGPEPMMQRLDWCYDVAGRFARLEPMAVLDTALGPLAREETRQAIRRAGSPRDALALLFASPEFQRR